ncbi:MAG: hypothetical protein CL827_03915 [Crocinitomicaceae bacterium]|nr:hypothetical protein [Crocinitomicaceae bacterium]|tara:strand:- start:3235 stop:5553 length:2319 start_codon:yes stop_codon:yes gene_type:complete
MKWLIYFILILNPWFFSINAQDFNVLTWRDHLPYNSIKQLANVDNIFYASTPHSIIEFDYATNEVRKLSTVNGLSEVGISSIVSNNSQKALIIGYNSSNVDIIKDDKVINISSILNSSIIGDKTIYSLYSYSKFVYLCTGFGIVVIDLEREEIKDTYIIGNNGSQVAVLGIHISDDFIYALTNNHIKYADKNSPFLSDAAIWNQLATPLGANLSSLVSENEDFYAFGSQNIVYKYSNNSWDTIINYPNENLRTFKAQDDHLVTCTDDFITIYNQNLDTLNFYYAYNAEPGITPNDIILKNGYCWVADESKGFRRIKNNFSASKSIVGYGGPFTNECFHLFSNENQLLVASGTTYGTNWNKTFNWHGIYLYEESWQFFNQITVPRMQEEIDTISDIVWVSSNPINKKEFVASSFGGGLLLFENNQLMERYSFHNSSLQPRMGQNGNSVYVAGSNYDSFGNLWIANSFTTSPLSVKTPDGHWQSFYCGPLAADKLCTDLVIDNQYGYVWMVVKDVGIVVYNYNFTPLDITDDEYKILGTSSGSGSLPSSNVNTLAIDNDGEIWVGTDKGPCVFYSSYSIFNDSNVDAQNILIELDGTLQYLLQNEIITDIVIDGANRKWFATDGGGLFLMSEDGTSTIYSLSKENSPLFSNKIQALAINNSNGELFIGTEKGILGFKSGATSSNTTFTELVVYPNPVRPDYQGNISVKGMMNNSEVKIVDASGFHIQTVFSTGGQAIWNGRDQNNQLVSSGVYYFFASSEDGYSKAKSKVLIIR